ncbi:hypothetical protein L915_15046, partial [Phytophthora nicotianae]
MKYELVSAVYSGSLTMWGLYQTTKTHAAARVDGDDVQTTTYLHLLLDAGGPHKHWTSYTTACVPHHQRLSSTSTNGRCCGTGACCTLPVGQLEAGNQTEELFV